MSKKKRMRTGMRAVFDQKDIGFSFDLTPVSTEYAQLQAVEQEYFNPMTAGIVSYEDGYEEAVKKLKEAGSTSVVIGTPFFLLETYMIFL